MRKVLVALASVAAASAGRAEQLEAGPADGHVAVDVHKAGVFSAFAHDHHFEVREWRATGQVTGDDLRSASVSVTCEAASLRDTHPGLSDADRRKVDAQAAGPDVLDAARHPRIEFRSERIEPAAAAHGGEAARGTVRGLLTVRGQSVPIEVPFEVDRASGAWRIRGTAHVKQSQLGIRPFSGFGGTVKVKDELDVVFAFTLRPVRAP
jgi:polyisoprenoid-binding protein YceI